MNQIINFFTTENEFVCNILTFPLSIIELWVSYIFIKTIYNLEINKKRIILYISLGSILGALLRLLLPMPYNTIIVTLFLIILNILLLKISIFKSTIAQIIIDLIILLFEFIVTILITKVLFKEIYFASYIPLYRILFNVFIYSGILLVSYIINMFRINLNLSDEMNKKQKLKTLLNILLTLIILCPNLIFLILTNMNDIPIYYIMYNFVSALLFFLLGTYNTHEYNKLDITSRELETANLYNKTLNKLVDANRGFKHDMNNIIQAIGGYLELEDYNGLNEYYTTGLLPEIEKVNNLSLLNPETINSAPIFGLFLGKYNYADSKNVKINLKSFFDYSTININVFDFVKIFGILLDNSIEAASLCEDKVVDIYVNIDFYNRKQVFEIKNTYINKDVNVDDIFKKDYSTKEKKSGFGLWEVKELIKKYQNTKLITNKDEKFFCQKLEIFF